MIFYIYEVIFMIRAAIYIRVSTEEQARHGFSLAEQEHDLTDYADKHHYLVVGVYADEGSSARKAITRRKQLQRLLDDVRADRVDIILLKCLDRWFRNVADFYKVQAILDEHHVQWVCTQEDYNTTTTNGRLMLNLKLSIAQNESDQTADRIKYVNQGILRRKREIGGKAPFGYRFVDLEDGGKRIAVVDEQRAAVEFIFASHLSGHSPMRIAHDVFAQYGIPITCRRVRCVLRNETYTGRRYGIDNFCPAIISPDTFRQAQERISGNKFWPKNRDFLYLFRGKIICPGCGKILLGHHGSRKRNGYVSHYCNYWCSKHFVSGAPDVAAGGCVYGGAVGERPIERYLLDHLAELLESYQLDISKRHSSSRLSPDQRIQTATAKLTRLKDLYVDGFIDKPTYQTDYAKLQQEISTALAEKQATRTPPEAVQNLILHANDIRKIYATMDRQHKYDLWQSTIKSIKIGEPKPSPGRAYKKFIVEFY